MNEIKVSVITVSYNSSKTIKRTIESVLHQTYDNIEYIIVDGASTDGTVDIVKSYEAVFNAKLKWVSESDEGIYYAMNKGIRMATGELVGIINSDDWYEPDAIAKVVKAYGGEKYQILYGKMRTWSGNTEKGVFWKSHETLEEGMIAHPTCFVSKAVYDDIGMYDTVYRSVADYDFMLRMHHDDRVIFKSIDEIIANFTTGGMSSTGEAWLELLRMQKRYNLISTWQYNKFMFKDRVYRLFHEKKN
ncbi:MAG: glycosyltransferase [Lachnospiraceae bacterium]|nr:glycosyltransferase [Lachnospiraceae bacterium]